MVAITDPDNFIKQQIELGRSAPTGALIACGVLLLIQPLIVLFTIPSDNLGLFQEGLFGLMIIEFLTPFAVWLAASIGMWALAKVLGGRPSIGDIVRGSAWGFWPLSIGALLWDVAYFFGVYQTPDLHEAMIGGRDIRPSLDVQIDIINQTVSQSTQGDIVFLVFQLLGVAFVGVMGYIWYLTVKHSTHHLNRWLSALIAAIPAVLYALVELGML